MITDNHPALQPPELLPCRCGRKAIIEEFYDGDDPRSLFAATCEICPIKTYDQFTATEATRIWNDFALVPSGRVATVDVDAIVAEIAPEDCLSRPCLIKDCGFDDCWGCDGVKAERERIASIIRRCLAAITASIAAPQDVAVSSK